MNSYRITSLMRELISTKSKLLPSHKLITSMSLMFCLSAFCGQSIQAQEADEMEIPANQSFTFGDPEPDLYQISRPEVALADQGFGWTGRLGHIAGQYAGREESISNIEIMPYAFNSMNGVVFADGRMFRANKGGLAGSIGGGYRQYVESIDRIFGLVFYYDRDDTFKTVDFKQIGLSVETLGENFDARANFYLPRGETNRLIDTEFLTDSIRFQGNFLLYDLQRTFGYAMKGVDGEIGLPVRTDFALQHNMRVYGGAYHYQDPAKVIENVWGWKSRVTADFFRNLNLNLEVSSDNYFGTNLQFGAIYSFDINNFNHKQEHKATVDRMLDRVMRNNTFTIAKRTVIDPGFIATDPLTNLPYFFRHVDSTVAGPGTGTFEDPFQQIHAAQFDTNYDIIYVHAGSVFNGADAQITTNAGKRMLGEGFAANGLPIAHTINDKSFGLITLPGDYTTTTVKPILNNSTGHGVTLNANSEFSGFTINNPTLNGIFSTLTDHSVLTTANYNTVNNAGLHGVFLDRNSGNININNSQVNYSLAATGGNGFYVSGGDAVISFSDIDNNAAFNSSTIDYNYNAAAAPNGHVLLVENTTGGQVNMNGAFLTENNGQGILVINNSGSVAVDNATISNSTSDGIRLENINGAVSLNNNFTINNPTGIGLNVFNSTSLGLVTIGNVTVNNRNDIGFNYTNNQGRLVAIANTTMNLQSLAGNNNPAVLYQSNINNIATTLTEGSVILENLIVNRSNTTGILIGDNDADGIVEGNSSLFQVNRSTNISNVVGDSLLITNNLNGNVTRLTGNVNVTNRTGRGIAVLDDLGTNQIGLDFTGTGAITGTVNVTDNSLLITTESILVQNNAGATQFGNTTVNSIAGINAPSASVYILDNENLVEFNTLNIDEAFSDALRVTHVNPLNLQFFQVNNGGVIDATFGQAVQIVNTEHSVNLGAVSNFGGVNTDYGIHIMDSDGTFTITGNGGGVFAGGTLFANNIAGIFLENTDLTDQPTDSLTLSQVKSFTSTAQNIVGNPTGVLAVNWTTEDVDSAVNSRILLTQGTYALQSIRAVNSLNTDQITLDRNNINAVAGMTGTEQVLIDVDRNRSGTNNIYQVEFTGNTITALNARAVTISGDSNDVGGTDPSTPLLNLTAEPINGRNNIFTVNSTGRNVFQVDWQGDIDSAVFNSNNFNAIGAGFNGNTGLVFNANYNRGDGLVLTNNNFVINSANARGILYNVGEGDILDINNNRIQVTGNNGLGIQIFTGSTTNTNIDTNTITVGNTNGTGIQIDITGIDPNDATNTLTADNNYFINGNTITLPDANQANFEQGIIFNSITGLVVNLNPGIDDTALVDNIITNGGGVNAVDVLMGNQLQLQNSVFGNISINGQIFSFP